MDALAPIRGFDRFQQRHRTIGIPIAVLKKFADDGAGNAAALIAYFGFFSLFPLLLLFVTVLGFVLQGDMSAQQSVLHSALKQFPFIGDSLKSTSSLHGSPIALVVGIVGAALSGLGVTLAAENAFNTVYAVPHKERANFLSGRLRGLKLLVVFGVLQLVSTVVSGVVSGGFGGVGLAIAGIVVSLLLNLLLFFAVFRLLTVDSVPTRELWPGIVLASVLWEILQSVGGAYVGHVSKGGGAYAQFGAVIAMLVWLYLGARVVVYSAEINTVLTRELWPRSILDPPTAADRRTRAALAKIEERDDKQTVDVTFHPALEETSDPGSPAYSVAPGPAPGEDARAAPWDDGHSPVPGEAAGPAPRDGAPGPAPGQDASAAPGDDGPSPAPGEDAGPVAQDGESRRGAWTPRGPWTRPGGRGE